MTSVWYRCLIFISIIDIPVNYIRFISLFDIFLELRRKKWTNIYNFEEIGSFWENLEFPEHGFCRLWFTLKTYQRICQILWKSDVIAVVVSAERGPYGELPWWVCVTSAAPSRYVWKLSWITYNIEVCLFVCLFY